MPDGQTLDHIDFELVHTGVVAGTITGEFGEPCRAGPRKPGPCMQETHGDIWMHIAAIAADTEWASIARSVNGEGFLPRVQEGADHE
jgi:hypothetical protein